MYIKPDNHLALKHKTVRMVKCQMSLVATPCQMGGHFDTTYRIQSNKLGYFRLTC